MFESILGLKIKSSIFQETTNLNLFRGVRSSKILIKIIPNFNNGLFGRKNPKATNAFGSNQIDMQKLNIRFLMITLDHHLE